MIIYTANKFKPRRKKKKVAVSPAKKIPLAKLRQLESAPLPKYKTFDRSIPSLNSNMGTTDRKEVPVYSGERELLGVAVMHKSNLVPVFKDNKEVAIEVAKMRRG